MALCTAAQVRLHLPELTGTAEDTSLGYVIARVAVAFARYCGYPAATTGGGSPTMETATHTLYLDGPGGTELVLPVWPVTAITSIYDDPSRLYAASSLVASGDYTLLNGNAGLVTLDGDAVHSTWSTGKRAIKATVTAGWATVPYDLEHAAIIAVVSAWKQRREQGRTNLSQQNVSVGLRDEELLPPVAREILAPYRLPSVLM